MIKKQNLVQADNNCLICYEKSEIRTFCSDCNICEECFGDYLISLYQNSLTKIKNKVKCANHNCTNKFLLVGMIDILQENKKQIITKLLFDNYLTNTINIVRCPKINCHYAAFLTDDDRTCDEFQCEVCAEKWKNKNKLNSYYSKDNLKAELTELIVYIFSVPCTNCSIRISKTEGCDHMKCVRCQTEFCYNCMKEFSVHLRETCECALKRNIKGFNCVAFVIFALLKFLLSFSTTRWILHFVFYRFLVRFVLMNIIGCIYSYIVFHLLGIAIIPNNYPNVLSIFGNDLKIKISQGILTIIGVTHLYWYYTNEDVQYYTIFFFKEIIIFIILCLCLSAVTFLCSSIRFRLR